MAANEKILALLKSFPEQVAYAFELKAEVPAKTYAGIVVAGMGGSALGGDMVSNLSYHDYELPISVIRGYRLPQYVGRDHLLFAVSYSGNTEEVLSVVEEAMKRGVTIVAIASGGKLAAIADEKNLPLIKVPADIQPRMAWAYLSIPILNSLPGRTPENEENKTELIEILKRQADTYSGDEGAAIAKKLKGKIPIIYSAKGSSLAAYKWKINFNENSKNLAFSNVFPELNHNEMNGLLHPKDLVKKCVVILLKSAFDHPRVQARMEITADIIKGDVEEIIEFEGEGKSRLSQLTSLIYPGDFVSYYLALENNEDPEPVDRVEKLKKELEKR